MNELKRPDDFMQALEDCALNEEIALIEERDTLIARACAETAKTEMVRSGCMVGVIDRVEKATLDAVQYPPDPHREALGRKLYERLNPDGTPWDKHGEAMHERYRAAAEAVREDEG